MKRTSSGSSPGCSLITGIDVETDICIGQSGVGSGRGRVGFTFCGGNAGLRIFERRGMAVRLERRPRVEVARAQKEGLNSMRTGGGEGRRGGGGEGRLWWIWGGEGGYARVWWGEFCGWSWSFGVA